MSTPKILDLDALVSDVLIVRLKGKDHPLKQATLNDFLMNAKDLERMGTAATIDDEMVTTTNMLKRAIPSLTDDDINGLKMIELTALVDWVHQVNGQKDTEKAAKEAAKTDPTLAAQ